MVNLFQKNDLIRQRAFRVMLSAISRPGTVGSLPDVTEANGPAGSLLVLLETLLDHEVSYCLVDADPETSLAGLIYEGTKSPQACLEEADFIVAPRGGTGRKILRAKRGRMEYPDLSATVVYAVEEIIADGKASAFCKLEGPGIAGEQLLPMMEGFDYEELDALRTVNEEFPLGVDAFFVDRQGRLVALPRSTRITVKESVWPIQR